MDGEEREEKAEEFEVVAEWVIRRLKKIETDDVEKVKRWVLTSLGLDELAQNIYLYLERVESSTTTEIAKVFGISPTTARSKLDDLHTVGLVDYIGREYHLTYDSIVKALNYVLIPRITATLKSIARVAAEVERSMSRGIKVQVSGHELARGKVEELTFFGSTVITKGLIEAFHNRGKRIIIKGFGSLVFEKDIDPELADAVIERVVSFGPVKISKDLYSAIAYKFKSMGSLELYD